MTDNLPLDFTISDLGPRKVDSPTPACCYVSDDERTLHDTNVRLDGAPGPTDASAGFELPASQLEELDRVYAEALKTIR